MSGPLAPSSSGGSACGGSSPALSRPRSAARTAGAAPAAPLSEAGLAGDGDEAMVAGEVAGRLEPIDGGSGSHGAGSAPHGDWRVRSAGGVGGARRARGAWVELTSDDAA